MITFYGTIENGQIKLDSPELMAQYIASKKEGLRIQVSIEREAKDPSHDQWKYIYGCVYRTVSQSTGMTIEEVDRNFKQAFAKAYMIHLPKGMELSKSNLTREWLSNYIDFIIQYSAEHGVHVDRMEVKK